MVANGFGPAQHLGVEPGRRRYPRRLQRERRGHGRLARGEEKVGDVRRSGTKLDESRHLGGQIDYRVLVNLWLMAIGQLDDVEARPPLGVWTAER